MNTENGNHEETVRKTLSYQNSSLAKFSVKFDNVSSATEIIGQLSSLTRDVVENVTLNNLQLSVDGRDGILVLMDIVSAAVEELANMKAKA